MAGLVKYKGLLKTLGGVDYVIPPISLGALEQMQERITKVVGELDADTITTVIDVTHSALSRNYPEITREEVSDIVDVGNMFELFEAVMDVSGLKRKSLEDAGESLGELQPK